MEEKQLKDLLHKYQTGKATEEEIAFLESWYLSHNEAERIYISADELVEDSEAIWAKFEPVRNKFRLRYMWPKIAVAASFLLFLYIGGQHLLKKSIKTPPLAKNESAAIVPGSNKAILTLSNGKQIILTGTGSSQFGKQGNTSLSKTAHGQLIYTVTASSDEKSKELVYNTITTPAGGQYWIILSDGSRVFLNAASSLRYPASFSGNERKVELKGEAYFEVVHNGAAPFRIVTGNQLTEDIGTKFNINAYDDEAVIKTTLVEGAVKISTQGQHVILKPGQQTQINNDDAKQAIKIIPDANVDEVIAWTNGLFEFNNADIQQVMNNAARWYDFKVSYENKIPDLKITGRISRNVNFSGLIDLLKFEGIKFRIQGKTVTILN